MKREELAKKIKSDLKTDIVMTFVSLALVMVAIAATMYFNEGMHYIYIAGVHFLLWFDSYLLTKRDLQILEVEG